MSYKGRRRSPRPLKAEALRKRAQSRKADSLFVGFMEGTLVRDCAPRYTDLDYQQVTNMRFIDLRQR